MTAIVNPNAATRIRYRGVMFANLLARTRMNGATPYMASIRDGQRVRGRLMMRPPGTPMCTRCRMPGQRMLMRTFLILAMLTGAAAFASAQLPPPSDVKAPPSDAKTTKSGLAYKVLTPGKGKRHPSAQNQVTVHYSGRTTDGKMFASSVSRGEPATFPLDQVIAGWTEGVQWMVEGEKARFWIPDTLAYKGQPQRPQGTLVFDIELISFK